MHPILAIGFMVFAIHAGPLRADAPQDEYRQRLAQLGATDVRGRVALAHFCLQNGLIAEGARVARDALTIDATSREALKALSIASRMAEEAGQPAIPVPIPVPTPAVPVPNPTRPELLDIDTAVGARELALYYLEHDVVREAVTLAARASTLDPAGAETGAVLWLAIQVSEDRVATLAGQLASSLAGTAPPNGARTDAQRAIDDARRHARRFAIRSLSVGANSTFSGDYPELQLSFAAFDVSPHLSVRDVDAPQYLTVVFYGWSRHGKLVKAERTYSGPTARLDHSLRVAYNKEWVGVHGQLVGGRVEICSGRREHRVVMAATEVGTEACPKGWYRTTPVTDHLGFYTHDETTLRRVLKR